MEVDAPRPTWGEKVCARRGWNFGEVFHHQFRIGPVRQAPAWLSMPFGDLWLEHCPDLPVTPILGPDGAKIGVLLGIAVSAEGAGYGAAKGAAVVLDAAEFDAVARCQASLAGRFALLVRLGDETRYYPDASSSLTAVMNPRARVLAASVPLAIDTPLKVSTGRSPDTLWTEQRLQLMGQTSDRRVMQLYANHYVNLGDFSTHRFWPTEDTLFDAPDADAVPRIADRLRGIMSALTEHFGCVLPVTGGQDSRLLVGALTPESAAQVQHYFVYENNWASGFDVSAAEEVAAHLGLPLQVKRLLHGEAAEDIADLDGRVLRAQSALGTGFSHPRLRRQGLEAVQATPSGDLLLRGGAAELAHANKWPIPRRIPGTITPDFALERMAGRSMEGLRTLLGDDAFEETRARYHAWFAGLPEAARARAPDVQHRELWLSGPFGTFFQVPREQFYLNPFNDHQLTAETMRFDPAMRRRGQLVKGLLDYLSPGLSDVVYATELRAQAIAA